MLNSKDVWVLGVSILAGLSIAGISIGQGLYRSKTTDRYVTVKGLAEREVEADLAVWPITFKVTGDNLTTINGTIESQRRIIKDFLVRQGLDTNQVSYASPEITDSQTEIYYEKNVAPPYRYIAQTTVTVRTGDVAKVKSAKEKTGELISKNIVIAQESWDNGTDFLFVNLNKIKPEMIEEATRNAREAAQKFAEDSGSKIGKIRSASQGAFTISNRDKNSPDYKNIRVVTTVEYFLVDD
jgi:hypothetical protein